MVISSAWDDEDFCHFNHYGLAQMLREPRFDPFIPKRDLRGRNRSELDKDIAADLWWKSATFGDVNVWLPRGLQQITHMPVRILEGEKNWQALQAKGNGRK
jgi:hypothetical protein